MSKFVESELCMVCMYVCSVVCESNHLAGFGDFVESWEMGQGGI